MRQVCNAGALRLYQKLGFIRDKRLHRYYLSGSGGCRCCWVAGWVDRGRPWHAESLPLCSGVACSSDFVFFSFVFLGLLPLAPCTLKPCVDHLSSPACLPALHHRCVPAEAAAAGRHCAAAG